MLVAVAPEIFQTSRLTGRRLTSEGFALQETLLKDPETMRTLAADGQVPSEERITEICERHMQHWARYGFGVWQIFETATGAYVGQCGIRNYLLKEEPAIEIFFALRSPYLRQGFGTEMARAVIGIGFCDVGAESLVGFTLPENIGSRRLMEKLGMHYEGVIEHAGLPHVLYRIGRHGATLEGEPDHSE
jgi:[ribosomal protein S5]-alanine N-acetyltransferase